MQKRKDIEYIARMMKCYRRLHQSLIETDQEIEWPECGRPDNRLSNFIKFMENQKDDEWAQYYADIAKHLESLIWRRVPKDI